MAKSKAESWYMKSTSGSGHFYTYRRPQKKGKGGGTKLERKKFDPVVRKHVPYIETKEPPKQDKDFKRKQKEAAAA